MKQTLSILLVFVVLSSYSDTQGQVTELRKAYRKEARTSMLGIQKSYRAKLEQALKKAEKFKHEEDAKYLREELDALNDPSYLLQEDTGVEQFQGTWRLGYKSYSKHPKYRIVKIDRSGRVRTKEAMVNGIDWLQGVAFQGKLAYDEKTKAWVYRYTHEDGTVWVESFKMQNGELQVNRWYRDLKYPDDAPDSAKVTRIK